RAVAGGGHAGRGGGEREAHGSGIGVGASGKRERQRQRNQCRVLHTSSSTRFGRLRLRSSRHQGGKRCAACGPGGARPPASTTRERPHMCSRHVASFPVSNRRKRRPP